MCAYLVFKTYKEVITSLYHYYLVTTTIIYRHYLSTIFYYYYLQKLKYIQIYIFVKYAFKLFSLNAPGAISMNSIGSGKEVEENDWGVEKKAHPKKLLYMYTIYISNNCIKKKE